MTQFGTASELDITETPEAAGFEQVDPPDSRSAGISGLLGLLRLALRLDRVRLTLWVLGVGGLVTASTQAVVGLYDTQAALDGYADLVRDNAALIIQAGPGYGLDEPTVGAVLMNELAIWTVIAIGLMSLFLVVRHTRTEEDTGRAELLRAGPVGRHAPLAAAVVAAATAVLMVSIVVVLSLMAFGLPTRGSLAFGATLLAFGIVFAAAGAVTAQVASSARVALGLGGVVLATSFILRAIGDVGDGRLSWLSPIGWSMAIRAFADERWWVLLVPAAATVALLWLAVALERRRDFGAGLVQPRLGAPDAGPLLASPLALSARLQRGSIIGWSIGVAVLGFFYGLVADQAESILEENPDMQDFFEQLGDASITDAFLSTAITILAIITSGFTISSILRMQREELSMRADVVLAAPVSRLRWAASHLIVSLAGTLAVVAACGAALGFGFALMIGDFGQVGRLLGAALSMVPALAAIGGVATLIYGVAPRRAVAAWGLVVFVFVVGFFGPILDLPQWVVNLSPIEHAPALPGEPFELVPELALLAVAAGCAALGLRALRRRDFA